MMRTLVNLIYRFNIKIKLLIIVFLLLCSCDSGCIPAGAIGSSDVKSMNVLVNPAAYISGSDIVPEVSYEFLKEYGSGSSKICDAIWKRLNLSYNPNYDYSIAYSGTAEFCNTTPAIPSTALTILTASMVNGNDMTTVSDGSSVSALLAAFSSSGYYNFTTKASLEGNKYDCLGEPVILYQHIGGVNSASNYYTSSNGKNDSVGTSANYTCNNASGCTLNTSIVDFSMVEIPRGCTVTLYDQLNGDDSGKWVKASVPVDTPSPYVYNAFDYRFDNNQLESQCNSWAIQDCISSLSVIQDSDSYVTCGSTQETYLYKELLGSYDNNPMILSGTQSSKWINSITGYAGQNVGNDTITTFAVSEGCTLVLYDGNYADNDPIYVPWPKIRDKTSEVFSLQLLCSLKDYSSWGYEVEASSNCGVLDGENKLITIENIIKSIKIEPNPIYDALSVFAKAFPDDDDYMAEFFNLDRAGIKEAALYFDGISNFMISNNIADYIRQNNGYNIILTITPSYCKMECTNSGCTEDCPADAASAEPRIIFATNRADKDTLGDYLAIRQNGNLEFNGQQLSAKNYYETKIQISISKKFQSADIIITDVTDEEVAEEDVEQVSLNSLAIYNDHEYFSFGQEWDYEISPSQFFKGYLYNFSLLSDAAIEEDLAAVVAILERNASLYNTGGSPEEITEAFCNTDFDFDDIGIAYGTDINTDFTVSDQPVATDGVFNIPTGISQGDNFYFRVKNSLLSCDNTLAENFDLYELSSGEITISIKESKDASGLVAGLQTFIVDPIVDIFDCKATDQDGNPTDCGGFYKMFYDQLVIGTPEKPSLFAFLVNTFLQFLIIIMGINVLFGLEKVSSWALIGRIIKIGLVYFLVSPGSWEFFNDYVITFVRNVPLEIGEFLTDNLVVADNIASSQQDKASMFDMLDNVTGLFLSSDIHGKIWGLLFASPTGIMMVGLIYYAIYLFFKGLLTALIQYVVIILIISLAIILAPFFIISVLLPYTKDFFTKWLDMLIGGAFKLMMLSLTVILFSYLIYAYAYDMFSYAVCWKTLLYCCDVMPFQVEIFEFFAPSTFDYRRFGIEEVTASAPGFVEVICFLIIVIMFYNFLDISERLSDKLAGGISISGVGKEFTSGMYSIRKSIQNTADGAVGKAYDLYHNEKGAWNRKKSNMKRDFYDSLNSTLTGEKTVNEKAAKKDMDKLFKEMSAEYAKEGKDMRDFKDDYKKRAKETLKSGSKFSDSKIDNMLSQKRFNAKLNKKIKNTENSIDDQALNNLAKEMREEYNSSGKDMLDFKDDYKNRAKERLEKMSTNVGNKDKQAELDKKIESSARKSYKDTKRKR
jgi:type IV secretory pathway VirB6-like protein